MKKIIFLFLMFSAMLFAKWEVGTSYTEDGKTASTFTTSEAKTESSLIISVVLEGSDGYSFINIKNKDIKKGDNLKLDIRDRAGNPVIYNIFRGDIKDGEVLIIDRQTDRSDRLVKMLLSGQSAKLYNSNELSATFNLNKLKKFMRKNVGFSDWYKYKLRNREKK
ncbi:hypothetical protein [uncultured Brachyspira sp.]|uniref:hypothetical protein n=1 Tax=uncultured Brachyspira sp. TaxID=221953 RepID=UPI00259BE7FD|nr:hypothetical protein [uncultured Brachyspira sp.]